MIYSIVQVRCPNTAAFFSGGTSTCTQELKFNFEVLALLEYLQFMVPTIVTSYFDFTYQV